MRVSIGLGIVAFVAVAATGASQLRAIPQPEVGLHRAAGNPMATGGALTWRGTYEPATDSHRVRATLDGEHPLPLQVGPDGELEASLVELSPGPHFLDFVVTRRGGRQTRISDQVLAGPWQADTARGCDLAMALDPEALRELLLPVIESKIVEGAKHSEYFGPTSYLARNELAVVDGGLRFDVKLDTTESGKGDISVAGVVDLRGQGTSGITASLRRLERATPGPKLEEIARAEGRRKLGAVGVSVGTGVVAAAGGGPLLGLAVGAGGGYLGGKLGEKMGEKTVRREARKEARAQIEGALSRVTDAIELPAAITVLPTDPALTADLLWCSAPVLHETHGLLAQVRLRFDDSPQSAQAKALAVQLDTQLPRPAELAPGDAELRVTVSGDLVNRLLSEWVVRGGLRDKLQRSGLADELQATLGDRTRWQVQGIDVEVPPMLRLRGDEGIDARLAGITVELYDPGRDVRRTVVLGGTGALRPTLLAELGRVRLGGQLDAAYLGCRERSGDRESRRPCFSTVLDPTTLRVTLNEQLRERSDQLPVLDLGRLFALRLSQGSSDRTLALDSFELSVGEGVLVIDADVK